MKPKVTPEDAENFQTIFAAHEGAVSAPAAGLHFSRELFNRMILKDIEKTFITVHMGIGHFRRVDVEDLSKHRMDSERLIIGEEAAAAINKAKRTGKKVVAVGVTVMRGLETYVTTTHEVNVFDGWTNKFIFPPYQYSVPDAAVSNFHLPQSTMLMCVAAFGGYDNVMNAYKVAPSPAVHDAHVRRGLRRLRQRDERVQGGPRGRVPLRPLRRRAPHPVA